MEERSRLDVVLVELILGSFDEGAELGEGSAQGIVSSSGRQPGRTILGGTAPRRSAPSGVGGGSHLQINQGVYRHPSPSGAPRAGRAAIAPRGWGAWSRARPSRRRARRGRRAARPLEYPFF